LQEIESELNDQLQVATDRRDDTQIIVAAPPEERVAAPGEITLKFGIASNIRPFPFDDQWQAAIDDFVASDPEVGLVQFDTPLGADLETLAGEYDCFYMPNNPISDADLSLLLNLDPLLSSDPSFDPDDMVGNVMLLARRNGMTWGLPMAINPLAMRYNIDVFNKAGVTPPVNGWTVEQFVDALRVIDATQSEDKVPFVPRAFGNSHLFMLIAAYGGMPFDYGVDPVGVNFTDPATVDAIRQLLDLAKDGYIQYNALATGGNFSVVVGSADDTSEPDAIYTEILSGFGFGGGGGFVIIQGGGADVRQEIGGSAGSNPNLLTTFPTGRTYSPVSYDLGMTLISTNTQFAEACYRFMRHISNNTELFTAMPVSRSLLNNPEYQNSQSPDAIAFYKSFDQILQQPNVIEIPAFGGGDPTGTLRDYWLNRAFDRYVLEDADLEGELSEAELFTNAYQECVADIPPFNPSPGQNQIDFFQQFSDCVTQVDPTAASFFGR
jgi:ABC-type glycerol-3-phosphate transport system substrate-binding protein